MDKFMKLLDRFSQSFSVIVVLACALVGIAARAQTTKLFNPDGTHQYFYLDGYIDSVSQCSDYGHISPSPDATTNIIGEMWLKVNKFHAGAAGNSYTGSIFKDGSFTLEATDAIWLAQKKPVKIEIAGMIRGDGVITGHWTAVYIPPCVIHYSITAGHVDVPARPTDIVVSLNVDDQMRTLRAYPSRLGIEDLEGKLAAAERELELLRVQFAKAKTALKGTSDEMDAVREAMRVPFTNLADFFNSKLDSQIQQTKIGIERLESWKQANGNREQTGPNPLRGVTQDEWNQMIDQLEQAKVRYEMLTSPFPEIPLWSRKDPKDSFDRAANQFLESYNKLVKLSPKQQQEYEESQSLDSEILRKLVEVARLRAELEQKGAELFRKATPSIEQVDVLVEGKNVAEALYSPQEAQKQEMLNQVTEKLAEEKKVLDQAVADKENAKKAFFREADAALEAGAKLGGFAIMLNAGVHAASEVLDVVAAARKGGVYGALTETLIKAEDFAVALVKSGGSFKDASYENAKVDEAKIEEQVKQEASNPHKPLTISELMQRAPEASDWATERAKDELLKRGKGWLFKKCTEYGVRKGPIKLEFFTIREKAGFDPTIKEHRVYMSTIVQALDKEKPSLLPSLPELEAVKSVDAIKEYAYKEALSLAKKFPKQAAKKYEEILWRSYFEHDLKSRVLFEAYRQLNEFYGIEIDRYLALQQEQLSLITGRACDNLGNFRIKRTKFPPAEVSRGIDVIVKVGDLESAKLHVEIQGSPASSSPSNRFKGNLPAGTPDDGQLHISVQAEALSSR